MTKITERAEPVDVVQPRVRAIPQQQQHDPRIAWMPADHLRDGEPRPEPLARAALARSSARAPDPPDGEDADHGEPDDLWTSGIGAGVYGSPATLVARAPSALVLVQPPGQVQALQGELERARRDARALLLDAQPLEQLREPGQVAELREELGGRRAGPRSPPRTPARRTARAAPAGSRTRTAGGGTPRASAVPRRARDRISSSRPSSIVSNSTRPSEEREHGGQVDHARDGLGLAGRGRRAGRPRPRASRGSRSSTGR